MCFSVDFEQFRWKAPNTQSTHSLFWRSTRNRASDVWSSYTTFAHNLPCRKPCHSQCIPSQSSTACCAAGVMTHLPSCLFGGLHAGISTTGRNHPAALSLSLIAFARPSIRCSVTIRTPLHDPAFRIAKFSHTVQGVVHHAPSEIARDNVNPLGICDKGNESLVPFSLSVPGRGPSLRFNLLGHSVYRPREPVSQFSGQVLADVFVQRICAVGLFAHRFFLCGHTSQTLIST